MLLSSLRPAESSWFSWVPENLCSLSGYGLYESSWDKKWEGIESYWLCRREKWWAMEWYSKFELNNDLSELEGLPPWVGMLLMFHYYNIQINTL